MTCSESPFVNPLIHSRYDSEPTGYIKTKDQIDIHVSWVPEHMNITGNEKTNQAAKKKTELQQLSSEKYVSLFYIKKKIKESALSE